MTTLTERPPSFDENPDDIRKAYAALFARQEEEVRFREQVREKYQTARHNAIEHLMDAGIYAVYLEPAAISQQTGSDGRLIVPEFRSTQTRIEAVDNIGEFLRAYMDDREFTEQGALTSHHTIKREVMSWSQGAVVHNRVQESTGTQIFTVNAMRDNEIWIESPRNFQTAHPRYGTSPLTNRQPVPMGEVLSLFGLGNRTYQAEYQGHATRMAVLRLPPPPRL